MSAPAATNGQVLVPVAAAAAAPHLLRRLRRRHGSWAAPGGVLALIAVPLAFSTLVIGPAVSGSSRESAGANRLVIDGAFSPTFHAWTELAVALGWLAVLGLVVAWVLRRMLRGAWS